MYSINMIDLQSSEDDELKLLVEAEERNEDVEAMAMKRLRPDGREFDMRACEIYRGLKSYGLVAGMNAENGFFFFELNQKGIDFIHDYDKSVEDERMRTREQRRHDYKVASYGAIAGGLLGLFSGALGSWLVRTISAMVS